MGPLEASEGHLGGYLQGLLACAWCAKSIVKLVVVDRFSIFDLRI